MATNAPKEPVEQLPFAPAPFSLLSVAAVEMGDLHRAVGSMYPLGPVADIGAWVDECLAGEQGTMPTTKTLVRGGPWAESDPFALTGWAACTDYSDAQARERATRQMENNATRTVEKVLWTGGTAGATVAIPAGTITPFLTGTSGLATANDQGAKASATVAVSVLEQWARSRYSGTPVLHMTAEAFTLAVAANLVIVDRTTARTYLGTTIVVGGGYTTTRGMAITGPIRVRLGPVSLTDGYSRLDNDRAVISERMAVIELDTSLPPAMANIT